MKRRERMANPKCLGRTVPDTFSARSAHLTGLKMRRITRDASFDYLVGEREQLCRHVEAERLGGHDTEHQLVLGWQLDRQAAPE